MQQVLAALTQMVAGGGGPPGAPGQDGVVGTGTAPPGVPPGLGVLFGNTESYDR